MIYFIESQSLVKIGYSNNPTRRLQMLSTGCPFECTLLGVIEGEMQDEADIHAKFAKDRRRGEWFALSAEIDNFIRENATPVKREKRTVDNVVAQYREDHDRMSLEEFGKLFTPAVDKSTVLRWERGLITPRRAIEIEGVTGIKRHVLLPEFFQETAA